MYRLIGLTDNSSIFCGMHHALKECEEVGAEMFQFMHDSTGIQNMVFVAFQNDECVQSWIYSNMIGHLL